jgi:hypothetical protein
VFHTSGALTKPEDFEEYEHLFDWPNKIYPAVVSYSFPYVADH